ncbi:helix-turn-helix domain-containing protein [Granulicella cerasi]|uniref:Helix-turn-helix domain-containing protein n=1 Tax=Granulicella cerasi TaxID=741063 RepID=A0ABW1ZAC7_9BACT|nr:helix-turn-helix domain-containing protein [Granulicella cerasi]
MKRRTCIEGQTHIFSPEVMATITGHRIRSVPNLALPFPRTAEVSVERVSEILGVSTRSVLRLVQAKLFAAYSPGGPGTMTRIKFDSLVEFCDNLRLAAGVAPRKPSPKGLRPRADDLLPFSLEDTITTERVMDVLDCGKTLVTELIEAGTLTAYKIINKPSAPWRIDVRSLERYMEKLRAQAAATSRQPATAR